MVKNYAGLGNLKVLDWFFLIGKVSFCMQTCVFWWVLLLVCLWQEMVEKHLSKAVSLGAWIEESSAKWQGQFFRMWAWMNFNMPMYFDGCSLEWMQGPFCWFLTVWFSVGFCCCYCPMCVSMTEKIMVKMLSWLLLAQGNVLQPWKFDSSFQQCQGVIFLQPEVLLIFPSNYGLCLLLGFKEW